MFTISENDKNQVLIVLSADWFLASKGQSLFAEKFSDLIHPEGNIIINMENVKSLSSLEYNCLYDCVKTAAVESCRVVFINTHDDISERLDALSITS